MVTVESKREPRVAQVDQLIDENGQPIALPENSSLGVTHDVDDTIGATGPTAWWRFGLIGLGIVAAILLIFQLMMGGLGTSVVPATPVSQTTAQ